MIVFHHVWKDLVLHFVIVYILLAAFPRYFSHTEFLFVSLVATLLLTLINHVFLPWFRLATGGEGMCDFAQDRSIPE